jgi:predicted transcriptional regulator YdeE
VRDSVQQSSGSARLLLGPAGAWPGSGLLSLATFLVVTASALGAAMETKVIEQQAFWVVGIQIRTSNAKELTAARAIPKQWEKFSREGMAEKIPHKVGSTIYAVYTDYDSNRDGEYDLIIGMRVSSASEVPPGMVPKKVPSGRYAIVTSAQGAVAQVVPKAWQQVWSLEDNKQLGGVRAYKADFERYDERSQNPQAAQVDLYIGLK